MGQPDHNLGGRNNEKSRKRREKKAAQNKKLVSKATSGRTNEVVFNEESRLEFVGGFRKRKQERRKYGLAMEVLKKQKAHREYRKELRIVATEGLEEIKKQKQLEGKGDDDDDEDDEDQEEEGQDEDHDEEEGQEEDEEDEEIDSRKSKKPKKMEFKDDHTQSMFAGVVSVEVDTGISEEIDERTNFNGQESTKALIAAKEKKQLTRFEKAMKVAKTTMNGSKHGGKKRFEKKDSTKLLHKALGAGVASGKGFKAKGKVKGKAKSGGKGR
jgi:ribosomal RNA-processing protein 17